MQRIQIALLRHHNGLFVARNVFEEMLGESRLQFVNQLLLLMRCLLLCRSYLLLSRQGQSVNLYDGLPVVIVTAERSTRNFTMKSLLPAFVVAVSGDAVTPVQKVIEMMSGMLEKGKKE